MISDFPDEQEANEAMNRRNTMAPGRANDWRAGNFGHKTLDEGQLHRDGSMAQDAGHGSKTSKNAEPTLDK